jgi:AraC-like DNA-binding protein
MQTSDYQTSWTQRVSGLHHLPGLLSARGIDPAPVFLRAGLTPDTFASPDNRFPYSALPPLLEECVRVTGCAHFGLLVGQQWRLDDFGLLGELMRNCATVGDAVRTVATHQRLYSEGAALYLFDHGATAALGYAVHHPAVDRVGAVFDGYAAVAAAFIAELSGGNCRLSEVQIPRAAPADPTPYRAHFGCPVRFDGDQCLVRFSGAALRMPIQGADPVRRELLEAEAARRFDGQLVPQLYRALRLLMIEGHVGGRDLADQFTMHRRTLDRRLEARGTTFGAVLEDVRLNVARQLLGETELPVAGIAAALGYAEASPFNRAFKRWTGMTPLAWRKVEGTGR